MGGEANNEFEFMGQFKLGFMVGGLQIGLKLGTYPLIIPCKAIHCERCRL